MPSRNRVDGEVVSGPVLGGLHPVYERAACPDSTFCRPTTVRYALCLMADRPPRSRPQPRADQALVAAYHEAQLANLLERVRAGFAAYDAGQLDAFGLDDFIHRYKRAASRLWSFCVGTGGQVEMAVTLGWKAEGNEADWWEAADPTRDRRR